MTLRDPGDFSAISPDSVPEDDGKPIGPSEQVGFQVAGGEPADDREKTIPVIPEEPPDDESVEPDKGADEQPDPAGLAAPAEPGGGDNASQVPEPPGEAPNGPLNREEAVAKRSVKMIKVERDPDPPYWVTVYRCEPGRPGNAGSVWMRGR